MIKNPAGAAGKVLGTAVGTAAAGRSIASALARAAVGKAVETVGAVVNRDSGPSETPAAPAAPDVPTGAAAVPTPAKQAATKTAAKKTAAKKAATKKTPAKKSPAKKTAVKKAAAKKTAVKKTATKKAADLDVPTPAEVAEVVAKKSAPATARQVADVAERPDVTTPVGTTGADVATNPDTAESDLQQPGTEPLVDPATAKALRSETSRMRRAAKTSDEQAGKDG